MQTKSQSQVVEAFLRPEQAGDPECQRRNGRLLGCRHQIDAEQIAEAAVVGAAGDLDGAVPFELDAVAGRRGTKQLRKVWRHAG